MDALCLVFVEVLHFSKAKCVGIGKAFSILKCNIKHDIWTSGISKPLNFILIVPVL